MTVRSLVFAAMMAGLAALLQTAPVWLGQPAGFALAALACLPVAVSALHQVRPTIWGALVAVALCGLGSPEEATVFAFTNGPFGLALGFSVRAEYGWLRSVLLAAGVLLGGMALLTWGAGFAALGPEVLAWGFPAAAAVYLLFALLWSALFTGAVRLMARRLRPVLGDAPDRQAGAGANKQPPQG